ncbi:MAG TPA: hypothetical protein VFY02_07510 [Gaiellaceae bacterium]|nr:hypothetical protein [Gaiellaceae bacterium]
MAEEAISDDGTGDGSEAPSSRLPLGALLIAAGHITEAKLAEALHEGSETGERIGEVVVRRGWATEDEIAKLLAEQWQLGYVERSSIFFDADALGRLTREEAQRLEALPTRVQDGRVVVAVAEPTEQRLADLREVIGEDTVVVVVPKTALDAGLRSELLSGAPGGSGSADSGAAEPEEPPAEPVHAPPPPPQPERRAVVTPLPKRARRGRAASADSREPELDHVLTELERAAAEATELSAGMSELAGRLAELVEQATTAAARLGETAGAREHEERMERLEQELLQRTELTEALKQQLSGLTRTLEDL